jgi:nicotinamidase-related amidase
MSAETHETALLVMDVQPGVVDRLGDQKDAYLGRVRAAVAGAHRRKLRVFYVVVGFRPGAPEVSASNKSFSAIAKGAPFPLTDPRPAIAPEGSDVVVTKRRVSAFTGSDLEVLLRAGRVGHLVLSGIATSGVVLSTLREAADKDYRITVLSDLCADMDPEVHAVLIGKVFPRQADILTSDEWMHAGS